MSIRKSHKSRKGHKGRKGSRKATKSTKSTKTNKHKHNNHHNHQHNQKGSGCKANGNWRNINNMANIAGAQKGGSPQSEIVMDNSKQSGVVYDYINNPRIRQPGYDDAFANPMYQGGGSQTSDMVMQNLPDDAKTMQYLPASKAIGNMNSLNLYQTTGGGSKSGPTNPKMKGGASQKQRGGGSDWIMSNYSQGNINAPGQPSSWVGQFSASSGSGRDMLMNPSSMGLAGSGYPMGSLEGANVSMTGAPI